MSVNIAHLRITSPDIESLGRIPDRFAGQGENLTPRVEVSGFPEGTVEVAVVLHDPDAPMPRGFTHWTAYGIAPVDGTDVSVAERRDGPNTLGQAGYVGPFPPAGHGEHHYYFWVYALGSAVDGEPTREEFLDRYADDILEQARFVGTYSA